MMQVMARRSRYAHCAIDQVAYLRGRRHHVHELLRDVLEEREEIDLLLIVPAECGALLLPDDRHHRLVIELRVVKSVQEMDGTGSGSREAHADLAGELGVCAGHECGELFVARLHEIALALGASERTQHPVDGISGIAVDAAHASSRETLQQKIADGHCHIGSLLVTNDESALREARLAPSYIDCYE